MINFLRVFVVASSLVLPVFCSSQLPAEIKSSAGEEKSLTELLSKNPKDYVSLTRLGEIKWVSGERKAALGFFRKAIKIDPEYPFPYYFLGQAYFLERKPEKAAENFNLFIEKIDNLDLNREDVRNICVSALHKTGGSFWAMKMYPNAYSSLRKIIELDSSNVRARYNLGVYYYNHSRDREAAFSEMKKVVELEPGSRIAAKAEFFIDYMRRNPDPRIIGDFSFVDEKE